MLLLVFWYFGSNSGVIAAGYRFVDHYGTCGEFFFLTMYEALVPMVSKESRYAAAFSLKGSRHLHRRQRRATLNSLKGTGSIDMTVSGNRDR